MDKKTKNTNTFRFKSFAERVNEIDLRRLALYHIGHENEELPEEDNETYFHQTLKKWMVLNLTEEFAQFSRKCLKIVTLPQLIHQKEFVVDLLLERLTTATNLSLQPLLELLYVLGRDLREEFYQYFQRVLDRLICLLNTQDAEQLEWALVCLAYLFKSLKPYLKKNIGVVFYAILPLLDEERYEEHVTNFAVECFSFIARDLRDYRKFLDFVLDTVAYEQVDSVQGCGRLLFEIMRGVKGIFHSVAGEFLQFIFTYLVDVQQKSKQKSQLLSAIVQHALQELLQFIHPNNMSLFWTQLCAVAQASENTARITNLIEVFLQATEYRDGRFLAELDVIVPTVLQMLEKCMQAKQIVALEMLCKLVSKILLCNCAHITQLDTSRLLKKVLTIEEREIFDEFISMIAAHAQFEILVLPTVLTYFERHFDKRAFELLATLVLTKQPYAENSLALQQWQVYPLQVKDTKVLKQLLVKAENITFTSTKTETIEQSLLLLILLPHLVTLEKTKALEKRLSEQTFELMQKWSELDEAKNVIILSLLLETQIHLQYKLSKELLQQASKLLLPYASKNLKSLSCLNQLIAQNPKLFRADKDLLAKLTPQLSEHEHNVRLIAAHCLATLQHGNAGNETYEIFYKAESIEPTVHNYREQLLLLEKFHTGGEFYKTLPNVNYKLDILRFLLGMLYNNFKFVWEPVLKLIEEYAKVLPVQDFWLIYKEKMEQTAAAIDYNNAVDIVTVDSKPACWQSNVLNELFPKPTSNSLTQQQLHNYRNLLWLRLPQYGQIVELKNRDLIGMFLQFVNEEYRKSVEKHEFTWNLSAETNDSTDLDDIELVDENDETDENQMIEDEQLALNKTIDKKRKIKRQKNRQQNSVVKFILQTMQSKMGAFVVQPNPKALYREPELYSFYMDLLAGPNVVLQKTALDCVLAYKWKSLMPYKEHLYAFIDEFKYKDELINFKLDTITSEHREQFMQILLRLLYGKMITKGTQRTASQQVRKALILRFLAQCSTAEILWFLQMAFGKYAQYTNVATLTEIRQLVAADFNVNAVWSARKLQSIVSLLELIRKEFGGLMAQDFQIYMLKLLVFVGSVCNMVLQTPSEMLHAKMHIVYRNVKNTALNSLVNFFGHIEEFAWQPEQIHCLTEVFVITAIEKLPLESIHTPTPLLKLLLQWGEKPQHFEYLNQPCMPFNTASSKEERVIFYYLIQLLLNEKAKNAVRKTILAVIERMLVCAADAQFAHFQHLQIIKPFIGDILKRLKMNFSTRSAKQALDKHDLNILSLLTAHVEDAATCDSLLQLLLPILVAKSQTSASEEAVCQVITTLSNLIQRLELPEAYLPKIAPLFEQVHEVTARKMLCQLVTDIAKKRHRNLIKTPALNAQAAAASALSENLRDTARLIFMLNAWDKRWVEQPDYDKRLDALKEITQRLAAGTVDMDLGVLVIYNCFYFLRHVKDMGLRDNASEHLRMLLPQLALKYADDKQQLNYLIGDVFINLIRRVIRDSNDNVRNEGIRLLGEMARQCPQTHEILLNLAPLTDKQDAEVDFFENMTHLQTHRHGRALLKFCSHAETLTQVPNVRTLTQFMLPLASRYLLQEKYASKHTLVDAAIETVGVICQLLPWQHYQPILRYYLMKLRSSQEYQKQCVRIVVRILDAFHFDLSQATADELTVQTLKAELKLQLQVNDVKVIKTTNDEQQQIKTEAVLEEVEEDEESLDDALTAANDDAALETAETNLKQLPVFKRPLILTANTAKRVMSTITTVLIPTLNRAITEKSAYDQKHKVNRKRFSAEREEEEILRVPIALALVKLMQKLPQALLESSLPGVFMKVCTFLRSPLKSVRMLTRDILKKIMLALSSKYLAMLIDHLQTLLTHGFQVHVLSVTIHGVLDALRDQIQAGDIERCLKNLLEVTLNDIFGDITKEKEIDKITSHTPEAKPSAKSYLVLHIIARNMQESCLLDLLMPFKEHLARSHSRKVTLKIQDCFAKIVSGLVENAHITRESLLIFIYGTMSESIIDLLPGIQKPVLSAQEKEKMRRARPDCYLIQAEPRMRSGFVNKQVKTNAQANAHILIEFGLEMLNILLKRKKLVELDYQPFLNPLLPLMSNALKSTHIRVTTFALKCFAAIWNDEYELPELPQYLPDIVVRMFEILKNFSTFGATKQEDNQLLVKSVYKAMVALLRKCTSYELTEEQIAQLVLHIEQDLFEGENQATMSFSLLKALLARKVNTRAVHDIMKRMSDICIVSQSDYMRDEARALIVIYIMEYTLKTRVDHIVKFFSVQLCYSQSYGRMSAIKFLHQIIKKFPQSILNKRAEFLYLSLATRLVNDEEPDCRRAIAECIELLLARLEKHSRQRLFDITLLFFDSNNQPTVREMAAALCSRFLNVEKQSFAARLKLVVPIIVLRLTLNDPSAGGRFVRAPHMLGLDNFPESDATQAKQKKSKKQRKTSKLQIEDILPVDDATANEEALAEKQRALDHEIIQMQYCIMKIFEYCGTELLNNEELANNIDELAYESQKLLGHEHTWVRCNAAKIIAHILAHYDYTIVGQRLSETLTEPNNTKLNFIYLNPAYDIKSLVLDLCAQMIPDETPAQMIDEIVKIFLYIANMLRDVPFSVKQEVPTTESNDEPKMLNDNVMTKINLNWLVRNIRFLINKEVAKAPHCTSMRTALFTLIEGLITLLSVETLQLLTPALLLLLVREMSEEDQNIDAELRQQALRINSRLRKRIGSDIYDKLRSGAQMKLMIRRAERKKVIAQEKVQDPVRAAKRRAGMQERKKAAKKRKTDVIRGKTADVKQKLKKRKRKAEDDIF